MPRVRSALRLRPLFEHLSRSFFEGSLRKASFLEEALALPPYSQLSRSQEISSSSLINSVTKTDFVLSTSKQFHPCLSSHDHHSFSSASQSFHGYPCSQVLSPVSATASIRTSWYGQAVSHQPFDSFHSSSFSSQHDNSTQTTVSSAASSGTTSQKLLETGSENGAQRPRQFRSGPVTWGSLALLIITGAGLLWYFDQEKQRRLASLKKVKSVGKAAIGGPICLVNHEGRAVTQEDLKGQWNLLYFGFTFCPDICPVELEKMAAAVDILQKKHGMPVRPVFISVDPERDTVEQVRAYVKEFHPKMLGLTGTVEDVRSAAREFRVYYMKTEEEGDDYLVDHSIIMYLVDPNWEFVKFFGKNHSPESLSEGVAQEIRNWNAPK